jgi:hypothetical protein
MLARGAVDDASVIHRLLTSVSLVCCTLVCLSFVLFAHDQIAGASKRQTSELVAGSTSPTAPAPAHKVGQPRRFIDAAAGDLTSPFDSIVRSDNDWVRRGFPAALALLVYGLGLGMASRYALGQKI